ncbi:MAG: hypothetical protein GY953_17000, partial [bacterium]|nr:hypothetical protein [bacterium]
MGKLVLWAAAVLLGLGLAATGQDQSTTKKDEPAETPPANQTGSSADARATLNLLGEVDADSGESRRNENVQFNLVDNNALKELNVRLGTTATIVQEFRINQSYFGSEYGKRPAPPVHARAGRVSGTHGNLFWNHNNSPFSARSFFQVGGVKPARENHYGLRLTTPLWADGFLTVSASQNNIRGNVNGNVLIPLPSERTPLTSDPELAAIVSTFLDAFPNETPNRPDISLRAHNTNSLQRIDTDSLSAQIDQHVGGKDKLILLYSFTGQNVDSFQFVTGQNPDTDIKNHKARLSWNRT